jgi:hypothetical protein
VKPFIEDWTSEDVDPLSRGTEDFDLEAVERALGEAQAIAGRDYDALVTALNHLVGFLVRGATNERGDTKAGRRVLALAWVINPSLFGGISLTALAKKVGLSTKNLSVFAAEVSRTFGIRNRGQAHAWNYKPASTGPRCPREARQAAPQLSAADKEQSSAEPNLDEGTTQ